MRQNYKFDIVNRYMRLFLVYSSSTQSFLKLNVIESMIRKTVLIPETVCTRILYRTKIIVKIQA
jgi:hypothetical protein